MFDNILRGLVVEFRAQHSALRYASGGMLDQCEDLRIYSCEWYRRPYMWGIGRSIASRLQFSRNLSLSIFVLTVVDQQLMLAASIFNAVESMHVTNDKCT